MRYIRRGDGCLFGRCRGAGGYQGDLPGPIVLAAVPCRCDVGTNEFPAFLSCPLRRLLRRGLPCADGGGLCLVSMEDVEVGSVPGAVTARLRALIADRSRLVALPGCNNGY